MRKAFILFAIAIGLLAFGLLLMPSAEAQTSNRAEILMDQTAGVVRVIIDGQEVARFTADGLHVRNDISFSGTIADTNAHVGIGKE